MDDFSIIMRIIVSGGTVSGQNSGKWRNYLSEIYYQDESNNVHNS